MKVSIALLSLIVIGFIINIFYKYYKEKELKKLVAWCVLDDSSDYRNFSQLTTYIENARIDAKLPDIYSIKSKEENNIANLILNEFQRDLSQLYFTNRLSIIKSIRPIPEKEYFMYKLCDFLDSHVCDSSFLNHDMHESTLSYKHLGQWGSTIFEAEYELSDFALVYYKMYYIAYISCKNSKVFNSKGKNFLHDDNLKKIIDNRIINISRF